MLKFAFLLLFLLNSPQISTASNECGLNCIVNAGAKNYQKSQANLPIEEQKKMIVAVNYVLSILKENDPNEKFIQELNFKKMKLQGAKLHVANEEISALDEVPIKSGWVDESHVELCPEFRDLRNNTVHGLSIYNFTFLIHYDTFDRNLSKIPDPEMDVKNLNVFFYHFSDRKRQIEVVQEVHEFSQRLRCLQSIKSLHNEEFIEKMTDLYKAYCYADKFSQDEKTKRNTNLISTFGSIFILIGFIFLFRCVCWCWC